MNWKLRKRDGLLGQARTLIGGVLISLLMVSMLAVNVEHRIGGGGAGFASSSTSSNRYRWGLSAVKAPEAWKTTRGSKDITVAVIDSGIDRELTAFDNRLWRNSDEVPGDGIDNDNNGYVDDVHGWDFRSAEPRPAEFSSLHYHGTFVAGLISSTVNQRTGSGGVAPHVNIMDLRFLDSEGRFYTSDWHKLADAIEYAVDNGAEIINMSLFASIRPPRFVHQVIKRAVSEGVLVVGIAGNSGGSVGYFGSWEEVYSVSAIDRRQHPASFSNTGPEVDIAAPGVQVLSLAPGGRTLTGSGTSFAAPHVSGTAALLLSLNRELSQEELRSLLSETAKDVGSPGIDYSTGAGIVDVQSAVVAASG